MFRRVLAWLVARFDTNEGVEADGEGDGFVPSSLDRSVRYAHGGNDAGERELADVRERARRLEERGRD
jgi:hypothetical protein